MCRVPLLLGRNKKTGAATICPGARCTTRGVGYDGMTGTGQTLMTRSLLSLGVYLDPLPNILFSHAKQGYRRGLYIGLDWSQACLDACVSKVLF